MHRVCAWCVHGACMARAWRGLREAQDAQRADATECAHLRLLLGGRAGDLGSGEGSDADDDE